MSCELPSFYPSHGWLFLTFGDLNLQWNTGGRHRVLSSLRLRLRDYDQYYPVANITIFFYDYFLTLADEVSHVINASLLKVSIVPPVKDQICLAWEEVMGWAGRIICCMAFVDGVIVFAIFLAVCPFLQQSSSFLKG